MIIIKIAGIGQSQKENSKIFTEPESNNKDSVNIVFLVELGR